LHATGLVKVEINALQLATATLAAAPSSVAPPRLGNPSPYEKSGLAPDVSFPDRPGHLVDREGHRASHTRCASPGPRSRRYSAVIWWGRGGGTGRRSDCRPGVRPPRLQSSAVCLQDGAAVMRKARRRCNSVQPVRTRAFCRVSRTRQGMLTTIAADSPLGYRPLRCHRSLCAQSGFLREAQLRLSRSGRR